MINQAQIETTIAGGLKKYLKVDVIRQNQSGRMPKFPYVAFTVTTYKIPNNGTWGIVQTATGSGTDIIKKYTKQVTQVWSLSAHSDKVIQAQDIAEKAFEWFDLHGYETLKDNGIVVERLGTVTGRDNMLSIQYEYVLGFDIRLALMDVVNVTDSSTIEKANLKHFEEV